MFPVTRLRRLRRSPAMRSLLRETVVTANDLIYPIFVEEDLEECRPIAEMPGVCRIPERRLSREVEAMARDGIRAVMMFGVSRRKDAIGSDAMLPDGLVARLARTAKDAVPEMIVMSDVCLCEYTDHGHCGVVRDGAVVNDETLELLARQAVVAADAGADVIAPSAMMDGQVATIRGALDGAGHQDVAVMAYSAKFASAFYGPFRRAAGCDLIGDRSAYQIDPMNLRQARRESRQDVAEGADLLMVKPATSYLDVLAELRRDTLLPLAAFQVSGEYAMIKFAAAAGAIDEERAVRETLGGIKRAGADLIISYFARNVLKEGW